MEPVSPYVNIFEPAKDHYQSNSARTSGRYIKRSHSDDNTQQLRQQDSPSSSPCSTHSPDSHSPSGFLSRKISSAPGYKDISSNDTPDSEKQPEGTTESDSDESEAATTRKNHKILETNKTENKEKKRRLSNCKKNVAYQKS